MLEKIIFLKSSSVLSNKYKLIKKENIRITEKLEENRN